MKSLTRFGRVGLRQKVGTRHRLADDDGFVFVFVGECDPVYSEKNIISPFQAKVLAAIIRPFIKLMMRLSRHTGRPADQALLYSER